MADERTVHDGDPPDPDTRRELIQAAPAIARLAAAAWWRTAEWTLATSVRTSTRIARAAASGESPARVFEDTRADVRQYARELLGLVEPGERTPGGMEDGRPPAEATPLSLREKGAALLRRSAEVDSEEDLHPAYGRILEELAPDEGRILRMLALNGPQPSVDVRTGTRVNSQLVAPGLTMIGAEAGCRHLERVHVYLDNLHRLGLIWFSRETLEDVTRYQVVEAQPEVAEAMEKPGRSRTVRRSIHLTDFGADFCEMCLPLDTEELEALPGDPELGDPTD